MANVVAEELAKRQSLKENKPVSEGGYDWTQILWFAQNIKSATCTNKAGENKGCVVSPGRARAGESLSDKIRNLPQGKVLDVSNMDINTGKGHRTVTAPKTSKSGKFGTGTIPIISNDINKYIRAIELAYGAEQKVNFEEDIKLVREALGNTNNLQNVRTTPAPVMPQMPAAPPVRGPSPTRQPGATLAPPPVFTAASNAVPTVASPVRATVGTMGGTGFPSIPALGTLLQQNR